MPDNELPALADLVNHGRAVTGLTRLQCPPQFLAGVLVESSNQAILAAHEANELITVNQGMSCKSPGRHAGAIVFDKVLGPQDLAGRNIEAKQMAHGSQRVDLVTRNNWCRPRSGCVADFVGGIVGLLPDYSPVSLIQAKDAFFPRNRVLRESALWVLDAFGQNSIRDKVSALGHS